MFFLRKQPDTVDLTHGTLEVNGFLLDGWTTDELFLRIFGENAAPSKKQATYVLRDTQVRLNDIEFNSVLVQFSPLGFHHQRVAENITLYVQPCKYTDFTRRVKDRLPNAKPTTYNEYDLIVTYSGMCITARLDPSTQMASLNIEFLDSASRVDNWIKDGCFDMVTPKSGAVVLNNKAYHANLRESGFKSELLPWLPAPESCAMDDNVMTYTFKGVSFYDIPGDVRLGFLNNKLASIKVVPDNPEDLLDWAKKHFGVPVTDEPDYFYYSVRAAGAREWYIRVYKQQPRMDWMLKNTSYT
ncbi:MAG: hypothetical protein IJZ68_09355 [Bacteroidaceae bacterium]|nr:hypothetical protein [Bacteroidaceae bacterium]